jgi:hypothetical protein
MIRRTLGHREQRQDDKGSALESVRRDRDVILPPGSASMVMHYSNILHQTRFGWAVAGGVPWLWPCFKTLHFIGMALLIGVAGTRDLRMLGVAKGLPLRPLSRLLPWGILGFLITVITGVGFYMGNPAQYQSVAFAAKMAFVALAGVNTMLFYLTGLSRRVDPVGAGQDVPVAAKLTAVSSLFLWFGVMFWGLMLPFFSNTF